MMIIMSSLTMLYEAKSHIVNNIESSKMVLKSLNLQIKQAKQEERNIKKIKRLNQKNINNLLDDRFTNMEEYD